MKHCEWCGREFEPKCPQHTYCSHRHKYSAYHDRKRRKEYKGFLERFGDTRALPKRYWYIRDGVHFTERDYK